MKAPNRAEVPKNQKRYSIVVTIPPGAKLIQHRDPPGGVPITPELRERYRNPNRPKVIVHPPELTPES
jgi:hypothetical protein